MSRLKLITKILRGLDPRIKRRTAFKIAAGTALTGAAGPVLKYATPPAKQAFNRGYRAWLTRSGHRPLALIGGRAKHWRKDTWRESIKRGRLDKTGTPVVKSARDIRAKDLRRIRELKQLGKKPSELTRRSFFTPKKGTR